MNRAFSVVSAAAVPAASVPAPMRAASPTAAWPSPRLQAGSRFIALLPICRFDRVVSPTRTRGRPGGGSAKESTTGLLNQFDSFNDGRIMAAKGGTPSFMRQAAAIAGTNLDHDAAVVRSRLLEIEA